MKIGTLSSGGSRRLVVASECVFCAVVAAGVVVGAYAIVNPNGIQFGAPWPVVSEIVAAVAAIILGFGIGTQRRGADRAVLALGIAVATIALVMLGFVALALSFNQV
jgi:hypothetical protein